MNINPFFTYNIEYLTLFVPSLTEKFIGLAIGILALVIVYFLFLGIYGWIVVRQDARDFQKKKNTLQDLIIMKDIQTEIEKEMEENMLKEAFN